MGNEQSQLPGLEIEEKAVEVTDFWSHHSASVNLGNVTNLSVFVGEPLIGGSLWVSQTPLEKASKNLMIHRHPSILKYVSCWHKGSKFYLAVEDVKPLSHALASQNTLQICIGLHSVLKALHFLHEKALSSHNNVCTASIYVTKDGSWKLGGMEYLCRFQDITTDYLNKTRVHRYDKSVDANEDKNISNQTDRRDCIDIYAYAELAKEVLKDKNDEDIPLVSAFKDLCKNELQNDNISQRPTLAKLLEHPFFTHEFISIHSFLTELPLKSDSEKSDFFSELKNRLKNFDEIIIAKQLTSLLLSRMVLLNKVAQLKLLPYVLCPQDESSGSEEEGLFSVDTFKKYITPKLLEIFCVRDAQIRLLLLDHFSHFMAMFSQEELQSSILPELLVGIKDTNDHLVAVTLRALADLVSILGAATVIGGKRAKLFNDGRPTLYMSIKKQRKTSRANNELIMPSTVTVTDLTTTLIETTPILDLPERPSPDGEEGETSTEDQTQEDDLDNWEEWETQEEHINPIVTTEFSSMLVANNVNEEESISIVKENNVQLEVPNTQYINGTNNHISLKKKSLPDITELDIKNQKNHNSDMENFDFFQDMEPVIESTKKIFVAENDNVTDNATIPSKSIDLGVKCDDNNEDGWGDDDLDW